MDKDPTPALPAVSSIDVPPGAFARVNPKLSDANETVGKAIPKDARAVAAPKHCKEHGISSAAARPEQDCGEEPSPMTKEFFPYGRPEMDYLTSRDKRLGEAIARLGKIERPVIPDLFAALVHSMVGQQISTKAHETIWRRMESRLGKITPEGIASLPEDELQGFGMTFRKAHCIHAAAEKALSGALDVKRLEALSDAEVCAELSKLDGVGTWTAEMLMLHSMLRPDIVSFGDLAVLRGMRMLYHHREITRELFEKYRRRYSPCGSVASIYLWAIAAGRIEGMRDYAPGRK